MKKMMVAVLAILALSMGTTAPANAEVDSWYGKKCVVETGGSASATLCAIVNRHDLLGEMQGLGRSDGGTCTKIVWLWTRLILASDGFVQEAQETDKTTTCAAGQYQSTPWAPGIYTDLCYSQSRFVVYWPDGGWTLATTTSYTVARCSDSR